jgi:hypothetical protein
VIGADGFGFETNRQTASLVQIGHGTRIGANTAISRRTAIAGSTRCVTLRVWGSEHLDVAPEENDAIHSHYRRFRDLYGWLLGPNAGKKSLTLQAVPTRDNKAKPSDLVSKQAGLSLHAGLACRSSQGKKRDISLMIR